MRKQKISTHALFQDTKIEKIKKEKQLDIFKKAEELIKFVENFLDDLPPIFFKKSGSTLLICNFGLFTKVVRTFKAIKILCDNELSDEAHCLLRVLVEAVVTLQNLNKEDSEERACKYLAYYNICLDKILNAHKNNKALSAVDPNLEKLIQSRTEELRAEYGSDSYEQMRGKVWKGIFKGNIEEAFRQVGQSVTYDTVYRAASLNIHGDDILNYIERTPEGSFLLLESNNKGADVYLAIAGSFMLAAMELMGKTFKLQTKKEIKKRKKFFSDFIKAI